VRHAQIGGCLDRRVVHHRDLVPNRLESLQEPDGSFASRPCRPPFVDLLDLLVERRRESVDRLRERSGLRLVDRG
jgi:hypothetical protein